MIVRFDKAPVRLGATPIEIRPNGAKVYEGTAAFGDIVKRYPDLDPPRNEFIPADEAMSPAALASLRGAVFTAGPRARDYDGRVTLPADHPSELTTPETAGDLVEGSVLDAWRQDPPAGTPGKPELRVKVIAYTRAIQDLIESGVHELSLGMQAAEDWSPGVADGVPYQVVQRAVLYDHLNLVERARSRAPDGRAARLDADADHGPEAAESAHYPRHRETPPMDPKLLAFLARTIKLDSLSSEDAALLAQMSPAAQAALKAAAEAAGEEAEAAAMAPVAAAGGDLAAKVAALRAEVDAMKAVRSDANMESAAAPVADAKPRKDGEQHAPAPVSAANGGGLAMLSNPQAVVEAARRVAAEASVQSYNQAAKFVGHVRKDGHAANTTDEAATVMLAVVKEQLPMLLATAEAHTKAQRLDALVPIYDQAEALRRAALVRVQADDLAEMTFRADAAAPRGETPIMFSLPSRGRAKT